MPKILVTQSYLEDIADAIREKNGTSDTYTPAQMATAISNISGGGSSETVVISVVDTVDSHGGTIREINAVDISDTTAVASDVAQGKYFYTSSGVKTAGTSSGGGGVSATQHTIHFEFSDLTDTDISVYYDDSLIETMITSYTPITYNGKTVSLAQLDNVTWFEPTNIPLNTELIDFTKCTSNTVINSQGQVESQQWYYVSDYTPVDSTMTFSYTGCLWFYIGVYDSSKNVLRTIYIHNDATLIDPNDSNVGHGTLTGSELTNAAYVRITANGNISNKMSLVRTA